MTTRCGEPVTVPGVFSATEKVVGRCVRAAGHEGPHRWTRRWEAYDPVEVEAEIARDAAEWEPDEEA